jgi:SPP1 family phage portal protein
MKLQEYINKYYDGSPYWFEDEVKKQWHVDRVQNILDIKEYLNGKHSILNRANEKFNGREYKTRKIVLQLAKTFLNFETSFCLKNPVTLTSGDNSTLEAYKQAYIKSRYNSTDFKLLDKMAKYGEIYEYLYIDNGKITSSLIQPEDSYPVFDEKGVMIAFIEYYLIDGISYYTVYQNDIVRSYNDDGGALHQTGEYNNLSGLPIQYKTIDEEDSCKGRSSLEDYITIIDSLEDLISKYHDGLYKYISGIPVLKGTKLNTGKNGEGAVDPNAIGFVLQIEDGSDFSFANNELDSASFKELYTVLMSLLLNISQTPAIALNSVEISNLSETSIRMLYALGSVKGALNANALKDGFIQRWERMKKLFELQGTTVNDDIDCSFEFDIPQNAKEIIDNLKTLREIGGISLPTLLSKSPYIYDVGQEMELLNKEKVNVNANDSQVGVKT